MIYKHTTAQIDEYFGHVGINQSALKVLIKDGIQAFVDQKEELQRSSDLVYEEKRHFIIGSAVDVKLHQTEEEFKALYHISTLIKKPGEKSMVVLKKAWQMAKEAFPLGPDADMMLYRQQLFIACNEEVYRMNQAKSTTKGEVTYTTWENDDSRIASLKKENAEAYWTDLCIADGKQILSDDEVMTISSIVMAFTTHNHTRWIYQDEEGVDIIFQMPVYFTVEDVDCKGMIDVLRVDHNKKRLTPIDDKTIGDYVIKFPIAVDQRRYDIQGAFYDEGVRQNFPAISELLGKDITGYTVANFAFAVESSIRPGTPLIWPLKSDMMIRGREGGILRSGYRMPGYVEALIKYKQWADIDFSLNRRFESTGGVILLGTDYDMNINL